MLNIRQIKFSEIIRSRIYFDLREYQYILKDVLSNVRISKDKILFCLVSCYFFITPFGNVFRFGSQEGSLGIGTIIIFLVVLLTFLKSLPMFFVKKIWFTLFLLLFWLSFSSLCGDVKSAYIGLLQLFIYVLFAMGMTTIKFTSSRLNRLFLLSISALLISSALTIIDFLGMVNIPFFNEFTKGVAIEEGFKIVGASGPFPRRSAMASYYGLLLPLIMVYGFLERKRYKQIFSFITFIIGIIALGITFNRAAPFAVILVASFFFIYGAGTTKLRLKIVFGVIFVSIFSFVATQNFFPNQMKAIKYKIQLTLGVGNYLESHLVKQQMSDMKRIYLAKETLKKVSENPIGYGLTNIPINDQEIPVNAHNNMTQIIWGAGIFGFFWVILFGVQCFKIFRTKLEKPYYIYYESIKYGLLGWLLISMTHTNWATGIAWALFGVMITLKKNLYRPTFFKYK